MEAKAVWIKDHQLVLETKGHGFVADVCHEEKGERCPPSPVDYFVASFAGCVAYFVSRALQNHGVDPKGLRVTVNAEYAEAPHRVGKFHVRVELPDGLSESLIKIAQRVAENCTVHNTFIHPPVVHFDYHTPIRKEVWLSQAD